MRHAEYRVDINYRLYTCDGCHELWLVPEDMRLSFCIYCNWSNNTLRELCILHRKREGNVGLFDKCDGCKDKFICASSVPKVWA